MKMLSCVGCTLHYQKEPAATLQQLPTGFWLRKPVHVGHGRELGMLPSKWMQQGIHFCAGEGEHGWTLSLQSIQAVVYIASQESGSEYRIVTLIDTQQPTAAVSAGLAVHRQRKVMHRHSGQNTAKPA